MPPYLWPRGKCHWHSGQGPCPLSPPTDTQKDGLRLKWEHAFLHFKQPCSFTLQPFGIQTTPDPDIQGLSEESHRRGGSKLSPMSLSLSLPRIYTLPRAQNSLSSPPPHFLGVFSLSFLAPSHLFKASQHISCCHLNQSGCDYWKRPSRSGFMSLTLIRRDGGGLLAPHLRFQPLFSAPLS